MALKDLLTDLSKFKYTNYENVGANNSQVEGRHGGYKGKGQPPHPEKHSKFDDKSGINLSKISGRHGGFEGKGQPPHPEAHSKFDDGVGGIGNPQSFTVRGYTVSDIISGRHGGTVGPTPAQPPHPDTHSDLDDGVGFGVYPSDNPQSFDVRGYTITGTKTFDRPNQDAITIMTNRVGFPYTPFESGVKTGPVDFLSGVQSSWGAGTLPLGFSFNMVDSLLSPGTPPVLSLNTLRHTIPEVGPSPEFTFSNIPKLADAHSIDSLSRLTGYNGIYITSQGGLNQTVDTPTISSNGITFTGIDGAFNHTLMRDRLYKHYQNHFQPTDINFENTPLGTNLFGEDEAWKGGSIHIGSQDTPSTIGGGLFYYGSLVSIIPRGSIYRAGDGTYRVPQSGHTTIPPGVTTQYPSNIPTFDGTQITHNIPQITLTGPFGDEDYQSIFDMVNGKMVSISPDAHGSDFMTTPVVDYTSKYQTQIDLTDPALTSTYSDTFSVSMITLSGPTTQAYHTTLNTTPISSGAHGSDFQTTPIEAYSSIFATQDELLMDSIYDSGFNRGDMYMQNSPITSTPIFKDFTQSDKSLKPSSEWDPQKYGSNFVDTQYTFFGGEKKEFRFDDRIPYNIPARDNNVIGFDQPFILKDIGDRWGPGGLGAIDEGLFRGGFVTSAARTVADVFRLGKFILTPTGIMFGLKQAGLQLLNPRAETRIWNPLSLGSVAPMVHVDRHLGGGTYEDAIDKDGWDSDGFGSILDGYADAVISPVPSVGLIFTTGRRSTLAHTLAMVPSMGGKMALPGIPELKWSDFPVGNIDSLSKNIVGENKYRAKDGLGNKEYTISDGTPIIPARNPEAGFSGGVFASRYAGSQLTQMFLNEDGLFPSKALTDAVIKTDIFDGNTYSIGNKEYPVTKGATPLISGIKLDGPTWGVSLLKKVTGFDVGDQGEYTGRSYAQLDEPILYGVNPFKTIKRVDGGFSVTLGHGSVINGIPEGNIYDAGEDTSPYQKSHNKNKLIPITGEQYGSGPGYGLANRATLYTITEKYDGTQTIATFGEEPPLALTSVLKTGIFQGDLYEKGSEYFPKHHSLIEDSKELNISKGESVRLYTTGKAGTFPYAQQKQVYKNVNDTITIGTDKKYQLSAFGITPEDYKTRGDRVFEEGVFAGDFYSKDNAYAKTPNIFIGHRSILAMGGQREIGEKTTIQLGRKSDTEVGIIDNRISVQKRYAFTHKFDSEGGPLISISGGKTTILPYNESLTFGQYNPGDEAGKGGEYERNPERFQLSTDDTDIKQIAPFSKAGVMDPKYFPIDGGVSKIQSLGFVHSIRDTNLLGLDGNVLSLNLYDKGNNYRSQISSFGTVSSPPTKTRLRIHADTGDPTVTIKTKHPDSDPNVVRLSAEGKYKNGLEDIKLQDFPLINLTGDGNLGGERQSLGFVNSTLTGLQGNLFGIPNTTRHAFGVLGHKKYTDIIDSPTGILGKGTLQGTTDTAKDGKLPHVSKTLAYEHKFAPAGVKDVLGTDKKPDFKTIKTPKNLGPSFSTRTVESNKTGNLLDRYKTLAYGDIPTSNDDTTEEKYGKHFLDETKSTKGGQYPGQAKDISTTGLVYQIDSAGKLGLVKKGADNSYMYGTKTGIGEPDKINMHPYGKEDLPAGVDDFIKFKFYDIVNKKHIIFRAFLSGISETFSPEWASEKYIGRPDSVHVYQGVERSMSFEFMIIPSSKQELPILWEKLNYLVGFTYPTWKQMGTTGKRMEAPFMNLTLGDMYNAVPGYLSSLSISVDDNSPWEIDEGFQLPHAINVSCEFTHIGQHALASQGTHYDFGGKDNTWLKPYNVGTGEMDPTRPNDWDKTGLFSPTPQAP